MEDDRCAFVFAVVLVTTVRRRICRATFRVLWYLYIFFVRTCIRVFMRASVHMWDRRAWHLKISKRPVLIYVCS